MSLKNVYYKIEGFFPDEDFPWDNSERIGAAIQVQKERDEVSVRGILEVDKTRLTVSRAIITLQDLKIISLVDMDQVAQYLEELGFTIT